MAPAVEDVEQELRVNCHGDAKCCSYFVISYKNKQTLLGIYPQNRKLHPHKNLYMDIYSSFSNNCQILEDTNISFT